MQKYLLLLALIVLPLSMHGQKSQNDLSKFDPARLIYGANIGFGISNNYWTVGGAPQIGYRLTDKLHVGGGLGYRYGKSDRLYSFVPGPQEDEPGWILSPYRYRENSVSINLWGHYYPWKKLIFSIKPELMHTWHKAIYEDHTYSVNKFTPSFVVGGGVHLKPVILQLNYELIQNKYSSYSDNVFFSIGFLF